MRIELPLTRPIVVFVRIEGKEAVREQPAIIDTGATHTLIPTEDAIDLGYDLSSAPRFPVATASGIIQAPKIVLKAVSIGELRATDVAALCYDIPNLNVRSLCGLSFLEHFKIVLDFKRNLLGIEDPL